MKLGLIDMGSNSIRYMEGYFDGTQWHNEPKILWNTRLGKRDEAGNLTQEAMDATIQAIEEAVARGRAYGVDYLEAIATSAMREAPNGAAFAERIEKEYRFPVHIISGEREAQIGFAGAAHDFLGTDGYGIVIDIGGASTEIAAGTASGNDVLTSYPVGAVRLQALSEEGVQSVWRETEFLWNPMAIPENFVGLIGIGGTCTTIAAMDLALDTYDPAKVHGHRVPRSFVETMALALRYKTEEEKAEVKGLPEKRRDIIVPGMEILTSFMDRFQIDSLIVSEKDGMEGWQDLHTKGGRYLVERKI